VIDRLRRGMPGLKARAKTLKELAENARIYVVARPLPMADKAAALLTPEAKALLANLIKALGDQNDWSAVALEAVVRQFSEQEKVKLGQIAQPLRAALTGSTTSPGIFEVAEILGRSESLGRLQDVL
jgi:glutamyl-tRNA synthetase